MERGLFAGTRATMSKVRWEFDLKLCRYVVLISHVATWVDQQQPHNGEIFRSGANNTNTHGLWVL